MLQIPNRAGWQAAGYEVHLREGRWVECSIEGHGERWSGKGSSAEVAIEQAMRKMAPSALARQSIDRWLREMVGSPQRTLTQEQPAVTAATAQATTQSPRADEIGAEEGTDRALAMDVEADMPEPCSVQDTPAIAPNEVKEPAPTRLDAEPQRIVEDAASDVVSQPIRTDHPELLDAQGVALSPPIRWVLPTSETAFDAEIEDIRSTMRLAEEDFAVLAPRAMLLLMAVWIGRARAAEETIGDKEAELTVNNKVIKPMRSLAKRFWPGALSALQLNATPSSLTGLLGTKPTSWLQAANIAADRFDAIANDGWADADEIVAPLAVEASLRTTIRAIDEVLPSGLMPDQPDAGDRIRAMKLAPGLASTLARRAQWLRWLRPFVDDGIAWGEQMGRLRWLAQQGKLPQVDELVAALDPAMPAPSGSWVTALGFDPRQLGLRKIRRELKGRIPAPNAPLAEVTEWFAEAARHFDADLLEPLVQPFQSTLATIDPGTTFPGKINGPVRNRLRKVLARLADGTKIGTPEGENASGGTRAEQTGEETGDEDDIELAANGDSDLIQRARNIGGGKRTLVVSNRPDPHLQRALTEQLGLHIESWCDASHVRAVQAACESVRNGKPELILALTGFMNHSTEHMLRKAAGSNTTILRCNRGRVTAVAHAIVRDLSPIHSEFSRPSTRS